MKFILTVDTEGDNQWDFGRKLTTENLECIPNFQSLCETYSISPTYLVTSEVCEDNFAKNIFGEYVQSRRAEVGAHLHVWTTAPFEDRDGYRFNDSYHGFANELPESLLRKKVENLTRQVEEAFGVKPTSFRSGRYGFDDTCAKVLLDNGYIVDSSVTPYIDWSHELGAPNGKGGPNFKNRNAMHYSITIGEKTLWEIPVTILPTKFPFTLSDSLMEIYNTAGTSVIAKAARKISFGSQPVWLRPYRNTTLSTLERVVRRAKLMDLEFMTMIFHSSELMAGCSPYRRNETDVKALHSLLEGFFRFLHESTISSVTLSEAARLIGPRR